MWYWCGHQASNEPVNTSKACSTGTATVTVPVIGGIGAVVVMGSPVRESGLVGRRHRLGGLLEAGEGVAPDAVEPGPQRGHAVRVEPVDPAGALGVADHQAAVLEDPQVLRHRRPADRQLVGQLLHRARAAGEQLEDGAPGRVAEQPQPASP